MFSIKAWGGVLEISDLEKIDRDFSRILHNLENFYRVNADQIKILNEEGFYKNVLTPSARSREALEQIKGNNKANITENYGKKPRKLKKHLLEVKEYFKAVDDHNDPDLKQQVTDILNYTKGLLLILKAIWR